MHDTFVIEKIIDEANKLGEIKEINIELGDLCNITKDHLKEHLSEQVDWKININVKKSKVKCTCGYVLNASCQSTSVSEEPKTVGKWGV